MLRQTLIAAIAALALPTMAKADPLPIEFLPPDVAPRDLCNAPISGDPEIHTEFGPGDMELTDALRIDFITRDIRRFQREDAERWFDYIDALITRKAQIDGDFAGVDESFARVALHLRARKMQELQTRALIPQLRLDAAEMTNNQRLTLARYYRDGIGVPVDLAFAEELLREAAFGGNARALAQIARMQMRGDLVEGWDAPLDLTVTMAFGGLLGEFTPGVCARAERIAQEYLKGELVVANPAIAQAWRRFAADMGGAEAAWQVVEYHLNAEAGRMDRKEARHYLERATQLGLSPDGRQTSALLAAGVVTADQLEAMLGQNLPQDRRRIQRPITPYMELGVRINEKVVNQDSHRLRYLREMVQMPEAPGFVFKDLAVELIAREGRWRAEAEAMDLLEESVRRGSETGMQMLAEMLVRYRDDPQRINRAENLLLQTVDQFGMASSMDRLNTLYRCQLNDAPRMDEARLWARNYQATGDASVVGSAGDIITLSPYRTPEFLARIQTQALEGRTQPRAEFAQRLQSNPLAPEHALRIWAERIARSDKALENFGRMQLDLASSAQEWALAVEFFRRVYVNNGVTSALDLAVALVEDDARDPKVAAEILDLLTIAGKRGEGASIRLKSRLMAKSTKPQDYLASAALVYEEFRDEIEYRGDFLALMFAIPFVPDDKAKDYIDRAVSLMKCGNKDADEVGDAYALRGDMQMAYHWRQVILQFEGGHILSKLRLSNERMELFDDGAAPSQEDVLQRLKVDKDPTSVQRLYSLTANPGLPSFDPEAAAGHFLALLEGAEGQDLVWMLSSYRTAHPDVQDAIAAARVMEDVFLAAARAGDAAARYEYGMLLRARATAPEDLASATEWLQLAAEGGQDEAMVELGFALGFGIGTARDVPVALDWLGRAEGAGNPRAADLIQLLSATINP